MELIYKDKLVYVFDDTESQLYAHANVPTALSLVFVKECYFGRFRHEEEKGAFGLHLTVTDREAGRERMHTGLYTDMRTIEDFMDAYESLEPEHVVGCMALRGCFKGTKLVGIAEPKQKKR